MQTFYFGIKVAALGVGTVFVVLFFLILIIKLMTLGIELASPQKNIGDSVVLSKETSTQEAVLSTEDDCELVAVITAAVACLARGKVRIKTIQRIQGENIPVWSAIGRQETMSLRQNR